MPSVRTIAAGPAAKRGAKSKGSCLIAPIRPQGRTVEHELARLAHRSHGVITYSQLIRAAISPAEIKARARSGALLREYRGVYRVGHRAPSVEARYLAAVLACGEGAVLSGRAAAHLWGLLKGPPPAPEVTARTQRRIAGVKVRRARRAKREATTWRGVPVTTPAQTLVDLAAAVDEAELARACHEAGVRHGTTPRRVEAVLARQPTAPGARRLRRVLHGDARVTLSRLEAIFLERLQEAELPLPKTNRRVGERRVDCHWSERRLTVELDGYHYHNSRHAWELDRRREREARARGDEFRRYSWGDVFEAPELMLAELRRLLDPKRPALWS